MDRAEERNNKFKDRSKKKKAPEKWGIIWKIKHMIGTLRKAESTGLNNVHMFNKQILLFRETQPE